jgi:hypothetical protein
MFEFSQNFAVAATPYAYLNFLNKCNDPLPMQVFIFFGYLLVSIDAGENFVMVDDVAMSSNPPITPVEK